MVLVLAVFMLLALIATGEFSHRVVSGRRFEQDLRIAVDTTSLKQTA